ncbi:MAG: hypothetical protein AAF065_04380 [Verrucomicrobiota bacterium]
MKYLKDFLKAQAADTALGLFCFHQLQFTGLPSTTAKGQTSRKWRPNHDSEFDRERGETAVLGGNN